MNRYIKTWGISKKDLLYRHALKYTAGNLRATMNFMLWADGRDYFTMHFLDEATFDSLDLRVKKARALSGMLAVDVMDEKGEV